MAKEYQSTTCQGSLSANINARQGHQWFWACRLWPFDDTIFQDNEFAAAMVTEEGPSIVDIAEQANVAAIATITHAEVHAVDVPVVVVHKDFPAELIQGPSGLRVELLRLNASPFPLKVCAQCEHTIYTGDTSVKVHTMDIPKPFHQTLDAKHA